MKTLIINILVFLFVILLIIASSYAYDVFSEALPFLGFTAGIVGIFFAWIDAFFFLYITMKYIFRQ